MNKLSGMGRVGVIGAGVTALALVGFYLTGLMGPAAPPADDLALAASQAGDAAPKPAVDAQPRQGSPQPQTVQDGPIQKDAAPSSPATPAPQIDIFRLQPDGEALIAGQGAAGWTVQILVDGSVQAVADPGSDDRFAVFLSLPQAADPRLLSLRMVHADGRPQIEGMQQIIVAPATPAPDAAPDAAPVAVADLAVRLAPPDAASDAQPDAGLAPAPQTAQDRANPAAAPQIVLMTDAKGARVLQSPTPVAAPRVMSNVALDTISYSDGGDVQLAGRAAGQGAGQGIVRVYLDNRPIAASSIAADGTWRTVLPQVDTGIYTLRIDEVTRSGTVTSRVETPFKREDRALLAELQNTGTALAVSSGAGSQADTPAIRVITVQPGNTLWAISRETYGEGMLFVRVFQANADRIRDPNLIFPGQVFTLPEQGPD